MQSIRPRRPSERLKLKKKAKSGAAVSTTKRNCISSIQLPFQPSAKLQQCLTMTFVQSYSDFHHQQNDVHSHYPPFPARLLSSATFSSSTASAKRRIRPIAVPPPPGFEPHSSAGGVHGFAGLPSATSSYSNLSSGYLNHVKNRAIAGALAGDWSVDRSMPDIPSFLLTHLLLHFENNSSSIASHDLASFCLTHNIHSNLTSPVFDEQPAGHVNVGYTAVGSSVSQSNNTRADIMADRLRQPLIFNQSPVIAAASSSASIGSAETPNKTVKRRLAPTQITAEGLFNKPLIPTAPLAPVSVNATTSFQRTPRAPKDSNKKDQLITQKELGQLPSALYSEKSIVEVLEEQVEFADIKSESASDIISLTATGRPKIPPPMPSSPRHRLSQRIKQLNIGKNTPEYCNYITAVPMDARKRGDPVTPDPEQEISKRNWEGQVRKWRRMLHAYDAVEVVVKEESESECESCEIVSVEVKEHEEVPAEEIPTETIY